MPSIAAVAADLAARPRPVLCLDTCDLLDIIQCVAEGKAWRLKHVSGLLVTLTQRSDCVQLVVTYLVPIEWAQNHATVIAEVQHKTQQVDKVIADIHIAWENVGAPLQGPIPTYAGAGLAAELTVVAADMLGRAVVLDRDDTCVGRALDRVYHRARPSHGGMVKDSIHLEHYLELCRQLRAAGFPGRCVFVSANKADFWEGKSKPDIHPDLAPQLASVGLEFFATLEAAIGSLGI